MRAALEMRAWNAIESWAARMHEKPTTEDWLVLRNIVADFSVAEAARPVPAATPKHQHIFGECECDGCAPVAAPPETASPEVGTWRPLPSCEHARQGDSVTVMLCHACADALQPGPRGPR